MVWNENMNGNDFTGVLGYFTVKGEKHFSWLNLLVQPNTQVLRKSIFGSNLKPKQTQLFHFTLLSISWTHFFCLDFHLFRKTKEISFPLAFKEVKNISDWNTGLGLANSEDEGKMEENSFSALLDNWRKIIRERGEIEAKWEEQKRTEERKKRSRERGAKIF